MHDSSPFLSSLFTWNASSQKLRTPRALAHGIQKFSSRIQPALHCASRRGEQRGKQSAPLRPVGEPVLTARRRQTEFTHLAGFGWERLPPLSLPIHSSLLQATEVNTKCSALKKTTVSSDLDKTNLCHLSIFATEIPDFTQLSLEFYKLATDDFNLP